jgi:hypothetical protein
VGARAAVVWVGVIQRSAFAVSAKASVVIVCVSTWSNRNLLFVVFVGVAVNVITVSEFHCLLLAPRPNNRLQRTAR